jgi:hypothetical protein
MKRIACLFAFLLASVTLAQDVPLTIAGGDVKIVKIDQVTIVKVDRTIVTSFPFDVKAPTGGGLYFWSFPSGVSAVDLGETLKVTAAPKGDLTIGVKIVSADWEAKKFLTKFGSLSFSVGTEPVPPPPPPKDKEPPTQPSSLYFLIVRPDGPASPAFSKIMADPAWAELTKAGHQFKDKTQTEALALRFVLPPGTTLPVVATLRVSADGKTSELVAGPIPLPTTSEGILSLGGLK